MSTGSSTSPPTKQPNLLCTMGKKRNRDGQKGPKVDNVQVAYQDVKIDQRKEDETRKPGTPHAFFESSWDITAVDKSSTTRTTGTVVHRHANGLIIVTAGSVKEPVQSVKMLVECSPECSQGERRKRVSNLLRKGSKNSNLGPGVVRPGTPLCEIQHSGSESITTVNAGVWGIVMELNINLTPALLEKDPLLDGYLAVILPIGSFPPVQRTSPTVSLDTNKKLKENAESHGDGGNSGSDL